MTVFTSNIEKEIESLVTKVPPFDDSPYSGFQNVEYIDNADNWTEWYRNVRN